eukprot:CAMPEP_0194779478 /NCGR_PEP_ID=MMETSP0323_2-20130528/71169_1 /TAXON_ID=2866 ORGANISM="Crypthecodinium cohnii, Strain Seligo" /NCGR_SAMPLE_ID=MMETSP0323_2 /ASSEMBLY_ACC=CAM_ASM_000346 /LENGTH=131 /DNA_ID=CAMNT_0039717143 /DNA_START=36 /DNA_END=427 /DNA_ORIENTATION=-
MAHHVDCAPGTHWTQLHCVGDVLPSRGVVDQLEGRVLWPGHCTWVGKMPTHTFHLAFTHLQRGGRDPFDQRNQWDRLLDCGLHHDVDQFPEAMAAGGRKRVPSFHGVLDACELQPNHCGEASFDWQDWYDT